MLVFLLLRYCCCYCNLILHTAIADGALVPISIAIDIALTVATAVAIAGVLADNAVSSV